MDLTGVYDAHIASADLHSTAATSGSVRSAHGLILLASLVVSENEDARSMGVLRSLDRFVVPGKNGAKDAARVIGALRSLAPALPTTYVHADTGGGSPLIIPQGGRGATGVLPFRRGRRRQPRRPRNPYLAQHRHTRRRLERSSPSSRRS